MSEKSARMIAEVVPASQDLATKGDIARLENAIARLDTELKGYIDSRLLRYTLAFLVPMWAATAGLLAALVARI